MKIIRPEADIPIIQMSVLSSEDPSAHFAMGKALEKLRDSNVAIIGSGFASFHNLRLLYSGTAKKNTTKQRNTVWSKSVTDASTEPDSEGRARKFNGWREWPSSYEMHPAGGAEHFLPLIVCAGAGGEEKAQLYTDKFLGMDMYSYYWT
jgi:aromatic ring-opening dioxygenase catalytic subunit (LigB family)